MNETPERLRVLILVSGLAIGEQGGGAERFGIELARCLDRRRFEPIVCGFWRRGLPTETYWVERLRAESIETFFAVDRGARFTPWSYVAGLRTIAAHLRGRPAHILHSQFQLGTLAAIVLRRSLGSRATLRTAHGTLDREWLDTLPGRACRLVFTRWLFPIALDAEVGVSPAIVESMDRRSAARLCRKPMHLIYNGIPSGDMRRSSSRAAARATLGLAEADLVIGSVGRLSEQKGYTYLLQALPAVLARKPGLKVILIGDGELRAALEAEAVALGVAPAVTFLGARADADLLYPALDLFVLPSLWEGLPTVALESMASVVPVVASAIPGTTELVREGETGWLAVPRDGDSLTQAILRALADPAGRQAAARQALERIVPRYTMEAIADQYEALYRQMASRSA
jgi:glycosyltransferase involved in cell wall biosynthesis